jgi:hypothetical protein
MACLTDLFNTNCLIILGIFVLTIALLTVYFESKIREQNHKFSSMFSLISALADEVNAVKLSTAQNIMSGGFNNTFFNKHLEENINSINNNFKNILINVSDDEEDEDSDEENTVNEDSEDGAETSDDDNTVQNLEINSSDVKVLKIKEDNLGGNNSDFNDLDDLDDLDETLLDNLEEQLQLDNDIELLDNKLSLQEIKEPEISNNEISSSEFKTIHVNLEEQNETLEYKKLPVNKLRDIVTEKLLTNDASKMKKQELLKLLGCE